MRCDSVDLIYARRSEAASVKPTGRRILSISSRSLYSGAVETSCQPYLMNRRDDDLRMFGWYFVAAVGNDLLAMARETSQLRL